MSTPLQNLIIILIISAATALTRFIPFILFPDNNKAPAIIVYLGKVIPFAVMMMLVIYGIKHINFHALSAWLPEIISIAGVIGLHVWKRNAILSIWLGTIFYMLLVQFVFI